VAQFAEHDPHFPFARLRSPLHDKQVSADPEHVLHEDEQASQAPESALKKVPAGQLQIPPAKVIFGFAHAKQVFAFVPHDLHVGSQGAQSVTCQKEPSGQLHSPLALLRDSPFPTRQARQKFGLFWQFMHGASHPIHFPSALACIPPGQTLQRPAFPVQSTQVGEQVWQVDEGST